MSTENIFQTRINYRGEIKVFLAAVCLAYNLGEYKSHEIITVGYEDLNIALITSSGRYFVKALASFRNEDDRFRYTEIVQAVMNAGIAHPKLYKSDQGFLHTVILDQQPVYVFVMEFIDGASFYELGVKPSRDEIRFLARQAAKISQMDLRPDYFYDRWAIINFIYEYGKVKHHLDSRDIELMDPVANEFDQLDLDSLPQCFVHGDIIDTNVMRDRENNLWILDFSVSNLYPRIQELAVLSCNLLFDPNNKDTFFDNYSLALNEYQKYVTLTQYELDALPLFIKVAHAMHIIGSASTKLTGEDSDENRYWMNFGRTGLSFVSHVWK